MGEFVALEAFVARRPRRDPARDVASNGPPPEHSAAAPPAPATARLEAPPLLAELAFARLAALEAFDRARDALLERFARDVLARELALGPAELATLARECLEAFSACEPVSLRVAPGEGAALRVALPVVEDPSLVPGDLILAVRDGEIDARFRVRAARAISP